MKTVQEILDLALKSTLYVSREEYDLLNVDLDDEHSYYMCDVLGSLEKYGDITSEEHQLVIDSIENYIDPGYWCLGTHLENSNLPNSHEDKIKIYKDWENKP